MAPRRQCRAGEYPARRLLIEPGQCQRGEPFALRSPSDAFGVVAPAFANGPQEKFVVLLLDSRNRLLDVVEIAVGAIDQVQVDPRLVLGAALVAGAPKFMVAHSHPSGDVEPSNDDMLMTEQLHRVAKSMALRFLDHLIVGDGAFFSFVQAGRFPA